MTTVYDNKCMYYEKSHRAKNPILPRIISDHLGSIRVVLTEIGGVDSWSDYYPFGKESRESSTTNELKEQFTGKERDIEIGLDYFGARYYNYDVARFMTIDPRFKDFPQWAPYLYAANNPIAYIDENGEGPFPWGAVASGAIIGGGVAAITQIINSGEINDPVDVAIAAGFGAFSGGSSAAIKSLTGKFFINVLSNVVEESAKSQLGSQTTEYGSKDAIKDAVMGTISFGIGQKVKSVLQSSDECKLLMKDADRLTRIAEKNGRATQVNRANEAIEKVENYGNTKSNAASSASKSSLGFIYNSSIINNSNGKSTYTTTGSVFTPTDNTKVVKTYEEEKLK